MTQPVADVTHPPDTALIERLHRQAMTLLNRGALPAADACCRELLALVPQHADALFLRGVIAAAQGSLGSALSLIRAAIHLEPARAEYHAQLARCLVLAQDTAGALAAAQQTLDCRPTDALTFDTVGNVLVRLNRHAAAVQVFRSAVALAPRNPSFQFNLATACKFTGEIVAAEQAYEACITASATFWPAHSGLAQLQRHSAEHNHIARLLSLQDKAQGNADAELHLHHALAKEYDDLGEHARAFQHLARGKGAKRITRHYSRARDDALFTALEQVFGATLPEPPVSSRLLPQPIFVVGMPRSGTTLVDRILSSHSQVESAGELPNFATLLRRSLQLPAGSALSDEALARSRDIDFARLGAAYLASVQPLLTGVGQRVHFIDKMPLNFLYLPYIHLALPHAKILCLRRNPLDTCSSNFRQLFALDHPQYDYSYDLIDIGNFYVRFDRLMTRWRELLGVRLLEVHYEELVAAQAVVTRRMLDFCGLDWEPACLHFQDNPTPVATASAVQVRTALHDRAVNRWRHYERELEPLRNFLAQHGALLDRPQPHEGTTGEHR